MFLDSFTKKKHVVIDVLTTIPFLHKQLDECFVVPQHILVTIHGLTEL